MEDKKFKRFIVFLKATKVLLIINAIFYALLAYTSISSYWDTFFQFVLIAFIISLILFILTLKLKDKAQAIVTWIGFVFSLLLIFEIVFMVLVATLTTPI